VCIYIELIYIIMKKKIKKIDEFLDDDSRFDFNIDTTELTEEQKIEKRDSNNRLTTENLKNHTKKRISLTIVDFRNHIQMFKDKGHLVDSDDELNDFCMKKFGEPFIKSEDNNE
jgi:hypothetical protein